MCKAIFIQGLGFGDEGKGATVDYYTRKTGSKLTVRFNGGCQAAHNVVLPNGDHHTFSQFGAGTLAGADTHLSRFMLVEPFALLNEAKVLGKLVPNPLAGLSIDPHAVITTPFHWIANQEYENHRAKSNCIHGSVGRGVGETRRDELDGITLRMCDLEAPSRILDRLAFIRGNKQRQLRDEIGAVGVFDHINIFELAQRYLDFYYAVNVASTSDILWRQSMPVVFEGAQGVLLDETCGLEPYRTWTDCTFNNAHEILDDSRMGWDLETVGVLRTYHTRHGAGPFPTEDSSLELPEAHNETHPYMGSFRRGHFDVELAKFALAVIGGVDTLALTHCDVPISKVRQGIGTDLWNPKTVRYTAVNHITELVTMIGCEDAQLVLSTGPTYKDRSGPTKAGSIGDAA